ncbi:MAG TPA: permease [Dissulfurispiraceae bacterium]|nr:permease [Dissulfurispiraceae bacterium]
MTYKEWQKLILVIAGFLLCVFLPIESERFTNAVLESLALTRWYAQEHVLLCLVPAFFIAGAIAVFVSQASVIKHFGARANKLLSFTVAATSGTILAVCSCTILPLFMSIYQRGAGLGPAIAFLYSGPAINVLAIILTARILGPELGIARAIGAVAFSVVIGSIMHLLFLREERDRQEADDFDMAAMPESRPLWQTISYFAAMIGVLVFANLGKPAEGETGLWVSFFSLKWLIAGFFLVTLLVMITVWFRKDELTEWTRQSWVLALQVLPLLLLGVLAAGFLLGRVGYEGIIPSSIVASLVGGNSLFANLFASVFGAFMYFATLTEVPILQGLIGAGMGKGPALALLLSGPSLSLPSILVINRAIGLQKTVIYVLLVIGFSTITGYVFGLFMG